MSFDNGSKHAADFILFSLIITAPSWSGVFGLKIFTNNCGDISLFNIIPVSAISCSFISLSRTINAPVLVLANSDAAITTL